MDRRAHVFASTFLLIACACVRSGARADELTATVQEIAPGVYVRPGHDAVVFEGENVANVGFIVGARCVAVIDSGGSESEGRALQRAIAQVTDRTVCYVIDTHAHPDHMFGNKVFADAGATVVGHVRLARALAQRAPTYLERASAQSGHTLTNGDLVVPTTTVSDTLELDLGDRLLHLSAHRTAHTDNDLTIYDVQTRTLWLGDLLFVGHVPVLDGSINGWVEELQALTGVAAARAVPGHGPPSVPWPQSAEDTLRYLTVLRDDLRQRIAAGASLRSAQENAGYTEASRWQLFDRYHARNVAAAYAELEWE
jgi:quinoprotein relay system zinc metallohydrolase 2